MTSQPKNSYYQELKQQKQINKDLINSGLPQNRINGLISMVQNKILCDDKCQHKKKADDLKQKWDLAIKQYKDAPENVRVTEKNYYIFDKGIAEYRNMLYDRYSKTAEAFKKTALKKHKVVDNDINNLLISYDSGVTYLIRMNEYLNIRLEENKTLKREIDDYDALNQTNGRKVIYEDRGRDSLSIYRYIFIFIYFLILVIYIVFGRFLSEGYKSWKTWIIIMVYILFPFYILNILVSLIVKLYLFITSIKIRNNVYTKL